MRGRYLISWFAVAVTSFISAASAQPAPPAPPSSAAPAEDGQWTMPTKNFASTRYSELSEINTQNVKNLQVAFTFSTGVNQGQESPRSSSATTMYILTPYPNILYALDLSQAGRADEMEVQPEARAAAQGVACCDVVNRGAAYRQRQDLLQHARRPYGRGRRGRRARKSGSTKLGDINMGETMTMAPLVVKDKVLVGNSRRRDGRARAGSQALDANYGKIVVEGLHTGPDQDVKIGPRFKPFYDSRPGQGSRRHDAGRRDAWKHGRRHACGDGSPTTRIST